MARRGALALAPALVLALALALVPTRGARGRTAQRQRAIPFPGGDLEAEGVFDAALAARMGGDTGRELIMMCVGDTKDSRRLVKDPTLNTLAVDFAVSLVRNLERLGITHYLMLTSSEALCRRLQRGYGVDGCAWSSKWADHGGQARWGVSHDEMFIMWAKQWHYVARAARERGANVLRLDSDVFFGEDPYPMLHGPYMGRFNMLTQVDLFQEFTRPSCDHARVNTALTPVTEEWVAEQLGEEVGRHPAGADLDVCLHSRTRLEMNIGMLYVQNVASDGPVLEVLDETVETILRRLEGDPILKAGKTVQKEALLDQPLFRVETNKRVEREIWYNSRGDALDFYSPGACPHDAHACDTVNELRARADVRYARLLPKVGSGSVELVAGAPDWLFGKACAKLLTHASPLMRKYHPSAPPAQPSARRALASTDRRARAPAQAGAHVRPGAYARELLGRQGRARSTCGFEGFASAPVMPAPGPLGHALVGVHMVYAMAPKRANILDLFGVWDVCPLGEETLHFANGTRACARADAPRPPPEDLVGGCFDPSNDDGELDRGIVASHTFFRDVEEDSRVMLCSDGDGSGGCPCCTMLPAMERLPRAEFPLYALLPDGSSMQLSEGQRIDTMDKLPGCGEHDNGAWTAWWN